MADVRGYDWLAIRAEAALAGVPDLIGRVADAATLVGRSSLEEVEVALVARAASWIDAARIDVDSLRNASRLWKAAGVLQSLALADRAACGPGSTPLRTWARDASRTAELLADISIGGDWPVNAVVDMLTGPVAQIDALEAAAARIADDG